MAYLRLFGRKQDKNTYLFVQKCMAQIICALGGPYHSDVLLSLLEEFDITPETFEVHRSEKVLIPNPSGNEYTVKCMGTCLAEPERHLIKVALYGSADYKIDVDINLLKRFGADGWSFLESNGI